MYVLNPLPGTKFKWILKGLYHLEHMLKTIQNLPNYFNTFTPKNHAIYVPHDYSVHLMLEIKEALLKRSYILVVIGGRVTGDVQVNDTEVHSPLKIKYRQLEQNLMICQLTENPQKIPKPSRNDMIQMLHESFHSLKIDFTSKFKALWVRNALNESKDNLVLEQVYSLPTKELIAFQNDLMEKLSPKLLKELMKMTTPPKSVNFKVDKIPEDEGEELFDCKEHKTGVEPDTYR